MQHGFAPPPRAYRTVWHAFDNGTGAVRRIGEADGAAGGVRAPGALPEGYVRVDISALDGAHPSWSEPVHAYFRRAAGGWSLVGFERMPNAPPMKPGLVGAEPLDRRR